MEAAAAASSECSDGPVMSLMNKRLRALKKKHKKILQMEETLSQGKPLNKEQEEVLRSKPSVLVLIEEYERILKPLSLALQEELDQPQPQPQHQQLEKPVKDDNALEDLVNLLYFGCLFDVKPQSDFTSTMLTRTHERGCCLTYDYVTDDSTTDILGEKDLDTISTLGGLVVSRPVNSTLSHKNALQSCLKHAKMWIAGSDQCIDEGVDVTYAALRERLKKILASDYITTTPQMKAPVEVAAASAGKYAPSNVAVHGSSVSSDVTVHTESDFAQYEQKDEESEHSEGHEAGADQSITVEEFPKESEISNAVDGNSISQDQQQEADVEEQNSRDGESKDQQYIPRRGYQNNKGNNRGSGGGRRGYLNGRGGRGSRGSGGYQNGRSQYYDQPGNYYQRTYYNTRGRSGGRGAGGNAYNNGGPARGGPAQADEVHS